MNRELFLSAVLLCYQTLQGNDYIRVRSKKGKVRLARLHRSVFNQVLENTVLFSLGGLYTYITTRKITKGTQVDPICQNLDALSFFLFRGGCYVESSPFYQKLTSNNIKLPIFFDTAFADDYREELVSRLGLVLLINDITTDIRCKYAINKDFIVKVRNGCQVKNISKRSPT